MRLTSTGLGIGTSSPARPLEIHTPAASAAGGTQASINNTGGNFAMLGFRSSSLANDSTVRLGAYQDDFSIYTNATERLRLDSSGNLGLGVTPSVHSSAVKAFDLNTTGGVGSYSNSTSTQFTYVSSNAYLNSSVNWAYKLTGYPAATYLQNNGTGVHQWLTAPSGTAGAAISFTQAMTLDASGKLGLATTSPVEQLTIGGNGSQGRIGFNTTGVDHPYMQMTQYGSPNTNVTVRIDSEGNSYFNGGNVGIGTSSPSSKLEIYDATSAVARVTAGTEIFEIRNTGSEVRLAVISADPLTFRTSNVEAMRIDAGGKLLVGTTGSLATGYIFNVGGFLQHCTPSGSAKSMTGFYNGGNIVGEIRTSTTSTAYLTSSDYRLKEDWVAVVDASTRVNALKPVNFAWKLNSERVDGFLAHELQEVVPEAVMGTKDAVDADGKPEYQGIDQSKLVPLLTAALQEALAKIESLEARLDAANI